MSSPASLADSDQVPHCFCLAHLVVFEFHHVASGICALYGMFYDGARCNYSPSFQVGGMTQAEAVTDVIQAKAMGFDAFALNVVSTEQWSMAAIGFLFQAATTIGFHLFFSFDMTHFTSPSQFFPLLQQYISSPAYYHYDNLPFVSM